MNTRDDLPTASLEVLRWRAMLLRQLREFFHQAGYWEVETPLLSQDTCVDAWLDPFEVPTSRTRYLQTSPEYCMKRLMTAGSDRIYQVAHAFRAGETGERHNPEFTLIEWYALGEAHWDQMAFTERLVRALAFEHGDPELQAVVSPSITRLSYQAAFEQFLGVDVLQATATELEQIARHEFERGDHGPVPDGLTGDLDGLRNLLLATFIEPELKSLRAAFLYDFPISQGALAQGRGLVAERFELYLDGLEVCNGYHELRDAQELRARIAVQNERRILAGKSALPVESRLLQAMDFGLPPCSGVALGWERLLMWLRRTTAISDVIAFPWDRA